MTNQEIYFEENYVVKVKFEAEEIPQQVGPVNNLLNNQVGSVLASAASYALSRGKGSMSRQFGKSKSPIPEYRHKVSQSNRAEYDPMSKVIQPGVLPSRPEGNRMSRQVGEYFRARESVSKQYVNEANVWRNRQVQSSMMYSEVPIQQSKIMNPVKTPASQPALSFEQSIGIDQIQLMKFAERTRGK